MFSCGSRDEMLLLLKCPQAILTRIKISSFYNDEKSIHVNLT